MTSFPYFVDQSVFRLDRDLESPYLPELPDHVVATFCRSAFEDGPLPPPTPAKLLRFAYERKNPYFHGQMDAYRDVVGPRPYVGVTVTLICGEREPPGLSGRRRYEQVTFRSRWATQAPDSAEGYRYADDHAKYLRQSRRFIPTSYVPDPINIDTDYALWEPHLRSKTRIRLTKWRPSLCDLNKMPSLLGSNGQPAVVLDD
jgi:hypothetical protein